MTIACITSCGSSDSTGSSTGNAVIAQPTTINLYPNESTTSGPLLTVLINGITVTNVQGTCVYGDPGDAFENDSLGFAQLTFGDTNGNLTTKNMPASTNGTIDVACATGTTTTTSCNFVSAIKYLDYGGGIHAGFSLSPVAIQTCDGRRWPSRLSENHQRRDRHSLGRNLHQWCHFRQRPFRRSAPSTGAGTYPTDS